MDKSVPLSRAVLGAMPGTGVAVGVGGSAVGGWVVGLAGGVSVWTGVSSGGGSSVGDGVGGGGVGVSWGGSGVGVASGEGVVVGGGAPTLTRRESVRAGSMQVLSS
jgi:hypothetical protein